MDSNQQNSLPQVFQSLYDFANVSVNFHLRPDCGNLSCLVDQERCPLKSHRLLAIHILFDPDAVLFSDGVIFIREQGKRQRKLFGELFVRFDVVGADSQNDGLSRLKFADLIAESAGFFRAAGGVIARIKVKHDVLLPFELAQFRATLGKGWQVERRSLVADGRDCTFSHFENSSFLSLAGGVQTLSVKHPGDYLNCLLTHDYSAWRRFSQPLGKRIYSVKVLPVLDVLNGQVVRGVAGRREEYRPIVSRLTASSEPLAVARAIRDSFGLDQFYMADLDGIVHRKPNFDLYRVLKADGFRLLVDAGVRQPSDVVNIQRDTGFHVVVGLETCRSPENLADIVASTSNVTFSLDLVRGEPRFSLDASGWSPDLESIVRQIVQANIASLIVLDLSDVGMGTGGSTDSLCRFIRHEFPNLQLIAGGGVRSREDLNRLSELGLDGVLVASALHDGRLVRRDLLF